MIGSQLAMPIIVLNMGGEMIYILHQRLEAQQVPPEKSRKVLEDVVRTMYTPLFLEELFKPQEIYSATSTKQIFEKLAHSSIMRLNKTSMDKLYDLMTMGVKYQLLSCKSAHQFLQVTLNHLDSLIDMVKSESVNKLVQLAINKSISMYSQLSNGNWLLLQQVIYQFFQGKKIKVSLFLQQNLQSLNGTLILNNKGVLPYGTEKPGSITYYENNNVVKKDFFHHELTDICSESKEVLESGCKLGMNMYLKSTNTDSKAELSKSSLEASKAFANKELFTSAAPKSPNPKKKISQSSAKAELNLLADLLGMGDSSAKGSKGTEEKAFKINLFPNQNFHDSKSDGDAKGGGSHDNDAYIVMDIDARADAKTMASYAEILDLKEFDSAEGKRDDIDDDLLDLMDSVK